MARRPILLEGLPFVEAIDGLRRRTDLTQQALERLRLTARGANGKGRIRAFEARVSLIVDTWRAATDALKSGETLRDYQTRLPQLLDAKGWGGANPYRASLIFNTQTYSAYSAGTYQQFNDLGVTRWRFETADDELVCPICGRLDGRIFPMSDRTYWPGVHLGCRCYTSPVFEGELGGFVESSAQVREQVRRIRGATGDEVNKLWERTMERANSFRFDPEQWLRPEPADLRRVSKIAPELLPIIRNLAEQYGVEVTERAA